MNKGGGAGARGGGEGKPTGVLALHPKNSLTPYYFSRESCKKEKWF